MEEKLLPVSCDIGELCKEKGIYTTLEAWYIHTDRQSTSTLLSGAEVGAERGSGASLWKQMNFKPVILICGYALGLVEILINEKE